MVDQITSSSIPSMIISPDWAALLVVDVQNEFCHENGVLGRQGQDVRHIQAAVQRLVCFIEEARNARMPVIFIKAQHSAWTNSQAWLTRGPRHGGEICAPGSWGEEFYKVSPILGEPVVVKHRHSAFIGTDMDIILRAQKRRSVLVTGVVTNVCVESTIRDAFARDYYVVLVEDCAGAASEAEHEASLYTIRTYFGTVLDSQTIVEKWTDNL